MRKMRKELDEFKLSIKTAISDIRTKLEKIRASIIVSEYNLSDITAKLSADEIDKYKRLSDCALEDDEVNKLIREARTGIGKAEKELRALPFTALSRKKELKDYIADKYKTIEQYESKKTNLLEKYGLNGYTEEMIKSELKILSNVGKLIDLSDKTKAKKIIDVTAFRKIFYHLKHSEKAALCIKDDIRSAYTANAEETISKAFKSDFDIEQYEKAVNKIDKTLGLDDSNRYMTKAKKETLTL